MVCGSFFGQMFRRRSVGTNRGMTRGDMPRHPWSLRTGVGLAPDQSVHVDGGEGVVESGAVREETEEGSGEESRGQLL